MSSILQNSFKNTFHASSSNEWAESRTLATDPRPAWKIKLDEAADVVNRQVAMSGATSGSGDSGKNLARVPLKNGFSLIHNFLKFAFTDFFVFSFVLFPSHPLFMV